MNTSRRIAQRVVVAVAAILLASTSAVFADGGDVWFGPNDHLVRRWKPDQRGPADFMQLFQPDARWQNAKKQVRYFQTNTFLLNGLSDTELATFIGYLNANGIRLAIEDGGMEYDPRCGAPVEGDINTASILLVLQRVKRFGGVVDSFVVDGPYYAGSFRTDSCQAAPSVTAQRVATFAAAMRSVFPNIDVGTVEPYLFGYANAGGYASFLDTFRFLTGREFAFLHCDMPSADYPAWYSVLSAVHEIAKARAIPFGIIYNGNSSDTVAQESSDGEWIQHARDKMYAYELRSGTAVDHAILESWVQYPSHVLPESDPTAHTNLILWYTRPRTYITAFVSHDSVSGRLADAHDNPVPGVSVRLVGSPTGPNGTLHQYILSGTVPAQADHAVLIVRANTECQGCAASVSLNLYDASYSEGNSGNRVPDHDFSSGGGPWGVGSVGRVAVVKSDRSDGSMLSVNIAPQEPASVNSSQFVVTPNSAFSCAFTARVSPMSFDGGYFGIAFLSSSSNQTSRLQVAWPFTLDGPRETTHPDGTFTFLIGAPDAGVTWTASFEGSDSYWPSVSKILVRRRSVRQ